MANRFYVSNTAAGITPAFSSSWDATASALRRQLTATRTSSVNATVSVTGTGDPNVNVLVRQFIFLGLASGGTSGGTVTGQILASEPASSDDYCVQAAGRIWSADGLTLRGTLFDVNNTVLTNEFGSSLTNRGMPRGSAANPLPVSAVTFFAGDALVVEVGFRNFSGSSDNASLRFTDTSSSDLPQNETATAQDNTWIEFSSLFFPNRRGDGSPKGRMKTAAPGVVYAPPSVEQRPPQRDMALQAPNLQPILDPSKLIDYAKATMRQPAETVPADSILYRMSFRK